MGKELGQVLKAHRMSAGLTQSELSKKFGYSSSQFISNWERGLSQPPLDILVDLCSLLRIPKSAVKELLIKNAVKQLESKIDKSFKRA